MSSYKIKFEPMPNFGQIIQKLDAQDELQAVNKIRAAFKAARIIEITLIASPVIFVDFKTRQKYTPI